MGNVCCNEAASAANGQAELFGAHSVAADPEATGAPPVLAPADAVELPIAAVRRTSVRRRSSVVITEDDEQRQRSASRAVRNTLSPQNSTKPQEPPAVHRLIGPPLGESIDQHSSRGLHLNTISPPSARTATSPPLRPNSAHPNSSGAAVVTRSRSEPQMTERNLYRLNIRETKGDISPSRIGA